MQDCLYMQRLCDLQSSPLREKIVVVIYWKQTDKGDLRLMKNALSRNNVTVFGEGKQTLIFGHGFGGDQSMFKHLTPAFEKDYRIISFDLVGSGESDRTAFNEEKYQNLHGYAQDLLEICEMLEVKNSIYIGHSVSAMIGVLASIKNPEYFERMIMIGPSPHYLNDSGYKGGFDETDITDLLNMMEMNYVGWASHLAPIAMNNPDRPELAENLEKSFRSNDPAITQKFLHATLFSDHRNDLADVTIPSLIIQCSDDSFVPAGVGEYLQQNLKNSQLEVMDVKGHYPHISYPDETIAIIKKYLSKY